MNATGTRKVPAGAPIDFVPTRWQGYLAAAETAGDATAYRHYWELCVLLALRDGLRSADVFVPGSRRYADPASYLMTVEEWDRHRGEFCHLVGKAAAAPVALAAVEAELDTALEQLDAALAGDASPIRVDDHGQLVIPRLTAESVPDEVEQLRGRLVDRLPRAQLVSVLIEMDRRSGFSTALTHAGGKTARAGELTRNLYACVLAQACNRARACTPCGASCSSPRPATSTTATATNRPNRRSASRS